MSGVMREPWKTIQSHKQTFLQLEKGSTSSVFTDTFILKKSEDLVKRR
jgi:hypothetical protein